MASTRGVKTRAGNTWTESRYFGFIRSALRNAFSKYPPKYAALKDARVSVDWGRTKVAYVCAVCEETYKATEVQVDHIVPAGSLKTYKDLPSFVERMFCEKNGLQVLCKECHKKKTQEERAARNSG